MGIVACCVRKPPLLRDKVVLKVDSGTRYLSNNDSLSSSLITIPTNFKMEFNWTRIQSICLGCSNLDYDLNLTLPMVKTVETVFDVIEGNLVSNVIKIFRSASHLGKQFKNKFLPCTDISDNDFRFKSTDDRILAHVVSYVKLHRLLLQMFERDIREAQCILNLVALSHLAMNVHPSDFRVSTKSSFFSSVGICFAFFNQMAKLTSAFYWSKFLYSV